MTCGSMSHLPNGLQPLPSQSALASKSPGLASTSTQRTGPTIKISSSRLTRSSLIQLISRPPLQTLTVSHTRKALQSSSNSFITVVARSSWKDSETTSKSMHGETPHLMIFSMRSLNQAVATSHRGSIPGYAPLASTHFAQRSHSMATTMHQ